MKKLLTLLLVTCVSVTTYASHLLGGMIAVGQTSQDSTSVGVWLITDPQGISSPNSIYVEKWEMNSVGWYTQNGTITLTKGTSSTFQGHTVVNYTSDYLDLDSNKYRFIYKNCCWGMINNSQNSFNSEFVISADYWHIPNNSTPFAGVPLLINQQVNTLNTMKPIWGVINYFMNEVDGDSVNVTQSDLYSSYSNGTFVSQTYTPLNLQVSNDSISWTPSSLGKYATGFEISDYRNGQLIGVQRIQWTFMVVNSTLDIEEVEQTKHYQVYDFFGNPFYEGENIPYNYMKGLYIIFDGNKTEKIHVVK